jgi:hypothetical protein
MVSSVVFRMFAIACCSGSGGSGSFNHHTVVQFIDGIAHSQEYLQKSILRNV